MSKNPVMPEPSEPTLIVKFDTQKFTTRTFTTIIVVQQNTGDEIKKFLYSVHQPMPQDIERQLKPRQAVSEEPQQQLRVYSKQQRA
ncbi:MAG: hypothetical protein EZS28_028846 [Streblomastix strix]|uniref:Uncharacterized protein n=1 Tax=Streblomastix strix TaxID=222440 RepID=A0A5J4UZ52_9EUKA|nr:MAG: hypothetical protein EZS28_028846 [Streblomastix strix]